MFLYCAYDNKTLKTLVLVPKTISQTLFFAEINKKKNIFTGYMDKQMTSHLYFILLFEKKCASYFLSQWLSTLCAVSRVVTAENFRNVAFTDYQKCRF